MDKHDPYRKLAWFALFVSILIFASLTVTAVKGYTDSANCTDATLSDMRVNPSQSVTWTPGSVLDVGGNPVGTGNSSLTFDGVNQYVSTATTTGTLNGQTKATLETWVKVDYVNTYQHYAGWRDNIDADFYILHLGGGNQKIQCRVRTATSYKDLTISLVGYYSKWLHIVFVRDGSNVEVFFNGVSVASATDAPVDAWGVSNNFFTGKNPAAAEHYLTGIEDEIRIYDRALTPTEIAQHYQGVYLNETGLVLYLDFDGEALDQSGNGNDGTLENGPTYTDGWASVPVSTYFNGTISVNSRRILVNSTDGTPLSTVPDTAPATYGNYTAVLAPDNSINNGTIPSFIVDQYQLTLRAVDGKVSAGYPATLYATGESLFDGHSLTDGDTVTLDGVTYTWSSILSRFQRTVTQTTEGTRTYGSSIAGSEATYNITSFTVNTIHVTWIDGILYAVTNGLILQAIWLYLSVAIGSEVSAGLIALGVMIPTYILSGRIEYSAGLWILLGGVLEYQLPGQVLGLGKVLFILGMAVFFWKIFIGGERRG